MADDDPWLLKEQGFLNVGTECKQIIYHPNLNVLLITTASAQVHVFDVNCGLVLQRCTLSGKTEGKLQGIYLGEGVDKILYTDGRGIGVRGDYNGVLLLDSILQMPVFRSGDTIKLEMLLSEAILLHHCLRSVELPGVNHVQEVLQELSTTIAYAKTSRKKGIKAQKWNTICLELPHGALKLVCSNLVDYLKKQNKHIPALPIASAISERLNGLLPGLAMESGTVDKVLMFSEAARRDTFSKWPHMNYKWALPDQMAQAGFYHQPNSTGEDRAMCFTCSVCLVCWEPTDEPWSEHERHSPACPFVKGEYTQNVPLSVTLATAPAQAAGETVDVIGTTNVTGLLSTASNNGFINVWNVHNQLKREISFYISPSESEIYSRDSVQFVASKTAPTTCPFIPNLVSESNPLVDAYKPTSSALGSTNSKFQLTALALVDGPKSTSESKSTNSSAGATIMTQDTSSVGGTSIRPCLVCGVSVTSSTAGGSIGSVSGSSSATTAQHQLRSLENVWATSTDLASSSSLVRAMNSVNSAASSNSLDIMKVATADDTCSPAKSHYLVLCDFHHKTAQPQPAKKDGSKDTSKSKKQLSGTGTSASSNGVRQESLYQEILLSNFLLEEINEDVDSEMVGSTHFDSIYAAPHTVLATPTANGIFYGVPMNSSIPTSSSFDANSNPISPYVPEQFASTSKMTQLRKTLDTIKTTKAEPVVIQTIRIEAADSLRINKVLTTKDGKHLFVTLSPQPNTNATETFSNTNQMDVDDETTPKSFMYWDHNDVQSKPLINGETQNEEESSVNSILLVYALDFSDTVVKLTTEPVLRRELPPDQAPNDCILLPTLEKGRLGSSSLSSGMQYTASMASDSLSAHEPRGQVALVCRDGVVRLLDLSNLKTVTETKLDGKKFISAAYCTRLERLCACTSDGALHFFSMTAEDDSTEEKDVDDLQMITDTSISDESELATPSTSTSPPLNQEHILAYKQHLTYSDLRTLYDLTRFDRRSPPYSATVPPCWSEMMQAQRQRRYPQHLHQSEDQHHTRTWRLQNDATTWDEHIFELTLPRSAAGNVGHVDVRFSLQFPCLELPMIQVTLLKQNMTGIGNKSLLIPVDEKIDFKIGREQKADNPIITEEYQRHHNTEILCGPVNLQRCMDLSDHSGCVTLTSPKLFRTKAKTLLVHIKALIEPTKEGASSKSRSSLLESKPPTSKKLRIDEAGPFPPGVTVERFAATATKKLDCYIGCDWIHEVSITVRSVLPTNIPNEKLQRCAMLESKTFIDNLLSVACLQTSDKSPVVQSLALDILIWVAAIRLTRLRTGIDSTKTKAIQLETVRCVQERLPCLLRTCLFHAGRSIAHKCVKIVVLCSEGLHSLDDSAPHAFEETVLSVLVTLLPNIVSVQWAGSLRWLAVLVTRLLPLDRNHSVAQQCINLIQEISVEMSKRVNPYHLLLATRFGLYNSPFETELFDMDPPVSPKSSSVPVTNTYSSITAGEQPVTSVTSATSSYTQDAIDLRDLLSLPSHSAGDLIVPSKLKALCANNSMKGLLEVEPLHFTCHAASDGTKMEKIDPSVNTVTIGGALYDSAAPTVTIATSSDTKVIHHAYNFEAGSLGADVQFKLIDHKLTDLLSQCTKNAPKANYEALSKKSQDFYTPDDQSDSDEASNTQSATTSFWTLCNDKSPTLTSVLKEKSSSVTNVGTSASKVEDTGAKKRDDISFPWGRLLCCPPQQALVVERMHSGARRFVILDFGAPVLLTDLIIPACSDLVSLSIDIWTRSEETDGIRLVVAGDIGNKPLVVSDLQPPPVCRFLKITTIGRYGMSTTRCKIPLGMFYGHMVVLPGEDYSELTASETNINNISDPVLQSTIESQCTILSALAEDVQCRFTLATERLKGYLDPLLCTETPNVIHMQHYLSHSKNASDSKDQPSSKILSTYQECIMYQHQLNTIRGVWQRLESWRSVESATQNTLASASSDKLRILGETLLDILLYTVYEIGPIPTVPTTLYETFTPTVCEQLFNSICVMTPAPHLQLYAVALLARMAGHQPWWGNFLANTLISLYSASSTHIFPQDRVFILLTFLGRKSLIAAANKSSVVDAMVRTLGRLLAPLSSGQTDNSSRLDITLIGWVLLFLSVCLDTTAVHPTSSEDNHDKNKEQGTRGFSSRWEFIQGELAMQRKFVSSSRSSASRSYRKKLQKRLMHHKQQLQDLEQAKKSFHTSSQTHSMLSTQSATFSSKLEQALKSQERFYKKTLKQHSAKHFKDLFSIRRNELHLNRSPRSQPQPSTSQADPPDPEGDYSTNLSHQHVLPVARGLVALLLNIASNVDMFLLACKVVARLVVSTRPAISLGELMTEDQLLKLIRLATGSSDTAWSSHAVCCLLQDLLEGEKLYPRNSAANEQSVSEEPYDPLSSEDARAADDDSAAAGTSTSSNTFGNDEGFADGDEDTQDSISVAPTNASTSKASGFNLPSLMESDDSEFEEFLDNILERGKTILKKGSAVSKYPTITSSGISQAIDARLEYGVETGVEISLRRLSALGTYNLPLGINATINPTTDSTRHSQPSTSRQSSYSERNQDSWNSSDPPPSSLFMLTRCFDKIFSELYIQGSGTNLELILQLWLTLNLDATSESNSSNFDASLTPVIPLSSTAITGLISAFSWHPGVSLRAWCYVLQCLTLASNQPLQAEQVEAASCSTPLDGLLGGMAGCIIKERNMGAMLLRLLSGNGLNVDTTNKHFGMAGPTLCQALQDFLLRLEMRCDAATPGSALGNSLKELLLWVVYQLVQPGGALVARRGPLDAQCKLITSLLQFSFTNTDLGTAMSISECVGELVSTYVRGAGVGAQCGGTTDATSQSGGFGGLYACVLGSDARQGRPASWDALVVALIKLVTKLVQTPLPNARTTRSDSTTEMELGESSQSSNSSLNDSQEKMNTSQTDESKVAEQQTSSRTHSTSKPRVPCVADTVLQHEPTMMRLLGSLGHSSGSSLAMLLGETSSTNATTELTAPPSIPDATFQLLCTLTKKASNPVLVLNPVYQYLASSCRQGISDRHMDVMQLSEPLLWFILRVLDNEASLSVFTSMGGVKVLCENLVKSSKSRSGNGSNSPGVIALVMQHLSNSTSLTPVVSSSSSKKSANALEFFEDGLLNFAPLGTVSWLHPTAQPADVLIQSATPHRRARTAAWSYHFYPDEAWVDLTITLPCAILLKEVELQPHLASLSTCPSAVALEISREGNTALSPICPPMPTAGLTFIRLTLSQPEVATAVLVRLYKPRDSTNISLSQIRLLGTTAFGDPKSSHDIIDEEQLTKTSLGWLRLVHQCLSVSTVNSNLTAQVLNSAASVDGIIESCCNLLLLPAPSLFTPNLERVLLQLGLHSCELGLRLINLLLNNRTAPLLQGSVLSQETTTIQMVVELLEQLCSAQDSNTKTRMSAVLNWLYTVAKSSASDNENNSSFGMTNLATPPAVYIHCISTIIWKAAKLENLNYDLKELVTEDLFDALYQWTLILKTHSALKQAIDAVLCAFCCVKPEFFQLLLQRVQILVPNMSNEQAGASISDDRKESEGQTDDIKSVADLNDWYAHLAQSQFKRLSLTEGQLLSIAAAARSTPGICQLLNSGLTTLLTACIVEFAILEKAKQTHEHQRQQQQHQHHEADKLTTEEPSSPSSVDKDAASCSGMTDSDKAGESTTQGNKIEGLDMNEPESIAIVLEFLSLICSEGKMRDWLGKDGSGFWLPLLTLLSDRPIENPSTSSLRCSKTSISYAKLEAAMIKFLSKCCWCHPANQKLLAELLTEVIIQQKTPAGSRGLHGISGFTRRLILQLLLEGEKILVSVTSEAPMKLSTIGSSNLPVMPPHPAFPLGHYHHLLYMSTQSTVADILQQVSGTWLLLLLPNNYKGNEAGTSSLARNRELWESGMNIVMDTLSVAAGNTAKDKRAKEASNRSQARGPIIRKTRLNADGSVLTTKSSSSNSQGSSSSMANQNYLSLSSRPNTTLPPELTIAQLLSIVEESGVSLSEPCLYLTLRQRNKDSKESSKSNNRNLLTLWTSIDSTLEVFSSKGGLTILAKHLPLVYPDSSRPALLVEKSPTQEQSDADWVKIEHNDNVYEDLEEGTSNGPPRAIPPTPQVPPHSLAAFGLFLRLPGYSEVLLRDRKRAQCLLRLALGVTDDGEGGDVLSSPLAVSLPTLPFQVLKQLLDDTPPTTDDGLLLRRTSIEVGAVLLLLNCLAIFTHQTGYNEGSEQRAGQSGSRSDDKSHLYWAKGTGFGTGSTQQSWNVEQALMRQRSEEEHVTILLQVLASYIGPGDQPQKELPAAFTELLSRSCLLPALSSYLRNDSVLDMARHIPLYRAVLQLLRAMANSSQLAPLLLPRSGKSGDPSIVSLLSSMRLCVDTYVHKINRTKNSKGKSSSKYPEDGEQDEGLATLIPDIQESATIVQNATARLVEAIEEIAGPSPSGPEVPLKTIEQRYLEVMKALQFDTYEMIVENPDGGFKFAISYHFESNMRSAGERNHPTRVKRLAQEAVTLSTALPLSYSSSVFVRCDTDRLDVMKVLITGPAETPYANGCFEFDVYFPSDYPNYPMMINLETTGRRSVRFNPNLYNDGKVCLSVLNTWHGRPEEKWNAHTSSFLQVLVSIQSLILVSEPYFNEPGFERSRGTSSGAQSSQEYNANVCQATAKWAMLDQIRNPCPCFKEVIHTHFWLKRHEIVAQIEGWIRDMEMHGADRRSARTISLSALALRRHYKQLREELNKLPTPEGLEDLAEPLRPPSSPLEMSGTPGTPSTPITHPTNFVNATPTSNNAAETSNHVHHDIDTDVEMEKMVSKVCE
ncbi:baculoviral IAP repeat-containing protein 6 isoform X2 [Nasonia vitripennis]|uniref:Dual E2 ubiquitin-conjugating enzyme/E3 ubiquitin-protein ligase BIRC6 n=1 Tax=Nasonia vitripennis TaxID=7425 RepID=A0A7M7IVP1_NASVI|nr:baculoviral IAP repeat-containing protein 6 isoform X2 [Nasonia vitripennis]